MSISVGDKVYNHETNESLEIVQLVGDIRDTHYKLSDDSVISIIDFITKPIYLIKGGRVSGMETIKKCGASPSYQK
ncbi:TPA: hypothetical protein OWV45_002764 [Staphylococcus aureus]|uniref:hypothetical protein n=1 Tax=Staphylococcus aureus TaxID=1280 RepID=UPI0020BE9C0F|nr:hypothetical protein [Staphylococcus aureus]HCV8659709.1 hypothetical protein [Staphylococcus aureus]HDJ7425063.1 hypothetical protein [Staphylococcus aureus]HDK7624376.1 hypothetical protein [Staphylococcus aureus]